MEATDSTLDAMVREIKNGATSAAQDLSKGVVPIILVVALLAPTWYLRGKLAGVENQLTNSAKATAELSEKIETLTPLVHDVADARAKLEALVRETERLERDRALTEARLRALDKDLTARIQKLELQR